MNGSKQDCSKVSLIFHVGSVGQPRLLSIEIENGKYHSVRLAQFDLLENVTFFHFTLRCWCDWLANLLIASRLQN